MLMGKRGGRGRETGRRGGRLWLGCENKNKQIMKRNKMALFTEDLRQSQYFLLEWSKTGAYAFVNKMVLTQAAMTEYHRLIT